MVVALYLIAQMVGADKTDYCEHCSASTITSLCGAGRRADDDVRAVRPGCWRQRGCKIIKAVLLLFGAPVLWPLVMKHVGFSFSVICESMAVPEGTAIMSGEGLVQDPISALSLDGTDVRHRRRRIF